jgi:hypothetical protein
VLAEYTRLANATLLKATPSYERGERSPLLASVTFLGLLSHNTGVRRGDFSVNNRQGFSQPAIIRRGFCAGSYKKLINEENG